MRLKINENTLMMIGLVCGYFSLMGYMLRCFLRRCANLADCQEEVRVQRAKTRTDMMLIWKETKVFNFYCSTILPLVFVFVYARNYLFHTFNNDPDQVKMIDLLRNWVIGDKLE
jgi:hypothetical protein